MKKCLENTWITSVTKVKELVSYYCKKAVLADLIYSKQHLCAFEVGIKMMDVSFVAILHKSPLEFPTRIFYELLDLLLVFFYVKET